MSEIFPAATVVLLRDGELGPEVLLLRRSKELKFAGGSWVFPGGRIDAGDYQLGCEDVEVAARHAAVRETAEEAGISINESGLTLISHWTPPPKFPKRFATWFFIYKLDEKNTVEVDGGEIDLHCWYSPKQALADFSAKHIDMLPPTFVTLKELVDCSSAEDAVRMFQQRPEVFYYEPRWVKTDEGLCMLYQGDVAYESRDIALPGLRHRLWTSDKDWHYERD